MIRIAIIAPAPALRAGLRALLSAGRGEAMGEANSTVEAGSLDEFFTGGEEVDVLLLAGDVFDEDRLRSVAAKAANPPAVLALSDDPHRAQALRRLPLRGWGLLPEDVSADELQAAVAAVAEGLVVGTAALFAPERRLLSGDDDLATGESLTERESQVLQHLARGLPNKQIALALGISEHTVKFHVSSIYSKLGVSNRTEAVRRGLRSGLVSL